jgi:GTPase SAR1 family protein
MTSQRKIMLLGDIGVGKTSLIRRLVLDRFDPDYKSTFGYNLYTFNLDGVGPDGAGAVRLVLWDTDGNLGVNILRHRDIMAGADAAIVVGDPTRPETHDLMAGLANGFLQDFPGRYLILVLNKSDLMEGAAAVPAQLDPLLTTGVPLLMTSAKTADNVHNCFRTAASAILRRDA